MAETRFTHQQRSDNMQHVLHLLKDTELDFNALIFTFADIINSTFLQGVMATKSKEERQKIHDEILETSNRMIDALHAGNQTLMIDVIALSSLLMDAADSAGVPSQD